MKRKSVSYLTEIRAEIRDSNREMMEAALDFSNLAADIDSMSIELIRVDESPEYKELMQAERALAKAIKNHKLAVKTLKEFF